MTSSNTDHILCPIPSSASDLLVKSLPLLPIVPLVHLHSKAFFTRPLHCTKHNGTSHLVRASGHYHDLNSSMLSSVLRCTRNRFLLNPCTCRDFQERLKGKIKLHIHHTGMPWNAFPKRTKFPNSGVSISISNFHLLVALASIGSLDRTGSARLTEGIRVIPMNDGVMPFWVTDLTGKPHNFLDFYF